MKTSFSTILLSLALLAAPAAKAADGCTVLLCLAGNWKNISVCVPPVEQTLRDMAFGKPFPTCAMGSASSGSSGQTVAGNTTPDQSTCPAMYSVYSLENNNWTGCQYTGMISVVINGQPWANTFWNVGGTTSTWYSDTARVQLGATIDPTYDNDLAAWTAANPPAPPAVITGN